MTICAWELYSISQQHYQKFTDDGQSLDSKSNLRSACYCEITNVLNLDPVTFSSPLMHCVWGVGMVVPECLLRLQLHVLINFKVCSVTAIGSNSGFCPFWQICNLPLWQSRSYKSKLCQTCLPKLTTCGTLVLKLAMSAEPKKKNKLSTSPEKNFQIPKLPVNLSTFFLDGLTSEIHN